MFVQVPWPKEIPQFVFKVARFTNEEFIAAKWAAEKIMRDRGFPKDDPDYDQEFNKSLCYALGGFIKRHVKGWEHTPKEGEEKLPFNAANLEGIFPHFGEWERIELSLAYTGAIAEEDKKKEDQESSDPASSSS